MKEILGYILIILGALWCFGRLYIDWVIARATKSVGQTRAAGAPAWLEKALEFAKAPYGPGIAMLFIGSLLAGVSLELTTSASG